MKNDYEIAQKIVDVILGDLAQRHTLSYELEKIDQISYNEMKHTLVSKTYIAMLEERHNTPTTHSPRPSDTDK